MDCSIPTASTMDQSTQTGANQTGVLYTMIFLCFCYCSTKEISVDQHRLWTKHSTSRLNRVSPSSLSLMVFLSSSLISVAPPLLLTGLLPRPVAPPLTKTPSVHWPEDMVTYRDPSPLPDSPPPPLPVKKHSHNRQVKAVCLCPVLFVCMRV